MKIPHCRSIRPHSETASLNTVDQCLMHAIQPVGYSPNLAAQTHTTTFRTSVRASKSEAWRRHRTIVSFTRIRIPLVKGTHGCHISIKSSEGFCRYRHIRTLLSYHKNISIIWRALHIVARSHLASQAQFYIDRLYHRAYSSSIPFSPFSIL
jgi:hypothetical protein